MKNGENGFREAGIPLHFDEPEESGVEIWQTPLLALQHGFATGPGGRDPENPYEGLNVGMNTRDDPARVLENRAFFAHEIGVSPEKLLFLKQIHSDKVLVIDDKTPLWEPGDAPEADGLVSVRGDVALGVQTADCAPVLLEGVNPKTGQKIAGALHAGWKGALRGVIPAGVKVMRKLGAEDIRAAIGPCLGPKSFELDAEGGKQFEAMNSGAVRFFLKRAGKTFFDLPGFCRNDLLESGVYEIADMGADCFSNPAFYSFRRACVTGRKDGECGRQLSFIRAGS